jgi:hypothetical protein
MYNHVFHFSGPYAPGIIPLRTGVRGTLDIRTIFDRFGQCNAQCFSDAGQDCEGRIDLLLILKDRAVRCNCGRGSCSFQQNKPKMWERGVSKWSEISFLATLFSSNTKFRHISELQGEFVTNQAILLCCLWLAWFGLT